MIENTGKKSQSMWFYSYIKRSLSDKSKVADLITNLFWVRHLQFSAKIKK